MAEVFDDSPQAENLCVSHHQNTTSSEWKYTLIYSILFHSGFTVNLLTFDADLLLFYSCTLCISSSIYKK